MPLDALDILSEDIEFTSASGSTDVSDVTRNSDREFIAPDDSDVSIGSSSVGSVIIVPEKWGSKRARCEATPSYKGGRAVSVLVA